MPEVSERKGSICSARPSGEKMWQSCLRIRGASLGSTVVRCSQACERSVVVVDEGWGRPSDLDLEGEESRFPEGYAIARVPPGVTRVALLA